MQNNRNHPLATSQQTTVDKLRVDARRFVDALTTRLGELEVMAKQARHFNVFSIDEYAEFRALFSNFRELCDEFQVLSYLAQNSLEQFELFGEKRRKEYAALSTYFYKLQVPMLSAVIRTNLHLLRVWDDRLQQGQGLPYGARELFIETVRVIRQAREELLRPRYLQMLDDDALDDAERASRLLRVLVEKAPTLFDFAPDSLAQEKDPVGSQWGTSDA